MKEEKYSYYRFNGLAGFNHVAKRVHSGKMCFIVHGKAEILVEDSWYANDWGFA